MSVDISVSSVNFIGVFVDKMSWERCPHVDYIISEKLFRIIYLLKQLKIIFLLIMLEHLILLSFIV